MKYPFVTVMIVTYNEEAYIKESMKSLLYQTYPTQYYEMIIIDSCSSDKTLEIAQVVEEEYKKYAEENKIIPVSITYLKNENKILASGWNLGIQKSKGDYVVRIDAHAYVASDFIEKSIQSILNFCKEDKTVCVGGSMETISDTDTGELIKEALSSPFGVGGSKFRYMKEAGYVDTVAYGLYNKSIFYEVGYFDENLVRTQDNDLHRRIRDVGGKFYLDPDIKSYYYSRSTIKKLLKQQFQNGKWTMINFLRRPGKMAFRHFIPFGFVMTLLLCGVGSIFNSWFTRLGCSGIIFHILCGIYFATKKTRNIEHVFKMPFLFLMIHIYYGIGSISGLLYKLNRRRE